jgi:hypothetical protein
VWTGHHAACWACATACAGRVLRWRVLGARAGCACARQLEDAVLAAVGCRDRRHPFAMVGPQIVTRDAQPAHLRSGSAWADNEFLHSAMASVATRPSILNGEVCVS